MAGAEPHKTDTTAGLAPLAGRLETIAEQWVAATAGEATQHCTVSAAGKKALAEDSREDTTFAGNEDEVELGLHNYLGPPVHDGSGRVVGTVCVLDDSAREYTEDQLDQLSALAGEVEGIIDGDGSALG